MNLRLIASALLSLFVAATASANAVTTCWESSGERYNVAPALLYAIAKTESGLNPRAINKSNANGSEDVGLMQINSLHFPVLAKHGITREHLFDPCTSIEVGAWILAQNAKQLGYNWNAVGAYNASSPDKRLVYAQKVYKSLMVLSPSLPASGNKREQSVAAPILVKSPNEKNR
ncbi:MAG: lytic transglycosylase domain-containing protein [Betaproteobacteria bacterium]|nr:lytic transglycosylase domain-containing protein [Betaproteobacteria bacterium]